MLVQEAKWTVSPSFVRLCKAGPCCPSVQSSKKEMDFTSGLASTPAHASKACFKPNILVEYEHKHDISWSQRQMQAITPILSQKVLCKPSIRAGEFDKAIGDAQVVSLVTWSCTFHHWVRGPNAGIWEAAYHPAWPSTINFARCIHSKLIALRHWKGTAASLHQFNVCISCLPSDGLHRMAPDQRMRN